MTRRLALVLLAAALFVVAACDTTTSGYHWPRYTGTQTYVYFVVPDVDNRIETPVRDGILAWNRSPYVETRVVRSCPVYTNCVQVSFTELGNGWSGVATVRRANAESPHMVYGTRMSVDVSLAYRGYWPARDTGCHEAGHTLGLEHGEQGSQGPPCDGSGNPTGMDLSVLAGLYKHTEAVQ